MITRISLLSDNADVYAESDFENKYLGILRFIPCKRANPCLLSFFFVFSSDDMNDEGLNCIFWSNMMTWLHDFSGSTESTFWKSNPGPDSSVESHARFQ